MSFQTLSLTGSKPAQYAQLLAQARALLHGERDRIANAANLKATIEDFASKHVLLEILDDEYGRGYRFSEEAVLPYLWILAAQKRFLEARKPAAGEPARVSEKVAEKPVEKSAVPSPSSTRAAGRS